jgi:flagellar biosynthetic protein FliQ
MNEGIILDLFTETIVTILMLSAPVLLISLIVGFIISVFQATTQIQEQTLSFVPKIIAIFLSLIIFGPWMITVMVEYTERIFLNINLYIF